jgi:hypothetical protein
MVPSAEQLAIQRPSGEKRTCATLFLCPLRMNFCLKLSLRGLYDGGEGGLGEECEDRGVSALVERLLFRLW